MSETTASPLPSIADHITKLEQALENIVSFWYPRCIDEQRGGYHLNFGTGGEDLGPAPRMVISQARMVWLFSRLAREGYRTTEMLTAAEHGYRYLTERLQDPRYGGNYWLVRVDGSPRRLRKHVCAQSAVLFALSEYGAASGHDEAWPAAHALFDLIEEHTHDGVNGGYREALSRKWGTPFPWQRPYMGRGASRHKSMNAHLHCLETLTDYYRVNPSALVRERLLETIGIQTLQIFGAYEEASTNLFEPDWTPVLKRPEARYSYGHDLENIWLLVDACEAAGVPVETHLPLFERLFDMCLRLGFDHTEGGFYFSGLPGQPADEREKVWWTQAESMVAALKMYRLTADPRYYEVFEKTWAYTSAHTIDWERGEWYHTVKPDGTPWGPKGSEWKDGYHNGRAMVECLGMLRAMQSASA